MATIDISVLDARLSEHGTNKLCAWMEACSDPNTRLTVNKATKLDRFLEDVKTRVGNNKIRTLSIFAHGFGQEEYADEQKTKVKAIHGGFGIEFCEENILLSTVDKFQQLNGLFESRRLGIKLVGCAAAEEEVVRIVPSGKEKRRSFGKTLCWALAKAAGAGVMASTSLQDVTEVEWDKTIVSGAERNKRVESVRCIDPGKWEGKVWIFTPDRKVTAYRET